MDAKETSIFTAVLITCIVLAVVTGYFIISIIQHQRRNQQLYKLKIQAEINTLEKERTRIAGDLHDELGPVLSGVKLKINSLDINSDDDQVQLENVNKHIDDIILRMREISNDLMPHTLRRKGLVIAVDEFIENIKKGSRVRINFSSSNVPEINPDKAIHLYRMIQEIIHNTFKHAKASELKIELDFNGNQLILRSEDDGTGFDYSMTIGESTGFGLRGLLSRTEIMGGAMYIESKQGKGTIYTFEIPFN